MCSVDSFRAPLVWAQLWWRCTLLTFLWKVYESMVYESIRFPIFHRHLRTGLHFDLLSQAPNMSRRKQALDPFQYNSGDDF